MRDHKRIALMAAGIAMSALIVFADYRSGPSIPFLMVYFIPVIWVNWTVGWRPAMAIACLNVLLWVVVNNLLPSHSPSWPPIWNVFRGMMYLSVSYMLCTLKRLADLEKKWALEDPLTGLANRRAFFQYAEREISRARRYGQSLTVALLDVDDFKQINDRWGHDQGDKVLIWIGKTLQSNLRSSDLLARLGGDELAVLLSDNAVGSAQAVMEKVHRSLQQSSQELGLAVSVSIGVATFHSVPATIDDMLRAADRQMYRVKQKGKNNLEYEVLTT